RKISGLGPLDQPLEPSSSGAPFHGEHGVFRLKRLHWWEWTSISLRSLGSRVHVGTKGPTPPRVYKKRVNPKGSLGKCLRFFKLLHESNLDSREISGQSSGRHRPSTRPMIPIFPVPLLEKGNHRAEKPVVVRVPHIVPRLRQDGDFHPGQPF